MNEQIIDCLFFSMSIQTGYVLHYTTRLYHTLSQLCPKTLKLVTRCQCVKVGGSALSDALLVLTQIRIHDLKETGSLLSGV